MIEADLADYLTGDHWYQGYATDNPAAPKGVGYFSPEFGITEVLPQYSGGLGILAGDHLKAASDLGVPIIGVGLLYRQGYFRQSLNLSGWQEERYPLLDPNALPVTLLHGEDGPVRIEVPLLGRTLHAQVWLAQVGRVPLLLLDSDVEQNSGYEREVTDRLYGGGSDHRLAQEVLLGIGGVRAIRAYCAITGAPAPEVFHTNEGHAGFLGLERIREHMAAGLDFDTALERNRAGTVFTTHTPVPAGIDRFSRELIVNQFAQFDGLPLDRVLALGAEDYEGGDPGKFNMAVMGFRLGQRANGVSLLHGAVSRDMFQGLWQSFDTTEVPITSITNGVHHLTWVHRELLELLEAPTGSTADSVVDGYDWNALAGVDSHTLWALKRSMRTDLIAMIRTRLTESSNNRGLPTDWISDVFDPDVLTFGFARRVPSYKRLTLMLSDPARLRALLTDPKRPIQIVIAGKSHPADEGGKALIQQMVQFADDPAVRNHIVFLPDYDISMAKPLYPGCDVWMNNPLRPYEACGTSGMKAALERGGEPVHPRRLVGRVVRSGFRLGDPVRGGNRRPGAARRPRGQGALRHHRERDRAAVLRSGPRRAARALDPDDPGDRGRARAEGAGLADGPGLRDQPVRPRGRRVAFGGLGRRRAQGPGRLEAQDPDRLVRGRGRPRRVAGRRPGRGGRQDPRQCAGPAG